MLGFEKLYIKNVYPLHIPPARYRPSRSLHWQRTESEVGRVKRENDEKWENGAVVCIW
jgi:hypothetical protein